MKKILLTALLTGFTALTAGQYIEADFEGSKLHLNIRSDAHTDTNMQYYIDVDNNPNTGMRCGSIRVTGADYLIENGAFYRFDGDDGRCDWDWDHFGGDWDRGEYDVYVPLSDIGLSEKRTIKVGAVALDSDWDTSYKYNKYGSDEDEMKIVVAETCSGSLSEPVGKAGGMMLEYTLKGCSVSSARDAVLKSIKATDGWGVPELYKNIGNYEDLKHSLKKISDAKDKNFNIDKQVYIIGLCNPKYASQTANNDDLRSVTAMMPCRISVYQKDNGSVGISMMNVNLEAFKPISNDMQKIIRTAF